MERFTMPVTSGATIKHKRTRNHAMTTMRTKNTRAVTWSVAAEREQARNHPAHIDNYTYQIGTLWVSCRECEWCGHTYMYETPMFDIVTWDNRGVVGGICPTCQQNDESEAN